LDETVLGLLRHIREPIQDSRQRVIREVDLVSGPYWEIGRHIVEFEQRGDRLGSHLRLKTADGMNGTRINFLREVQSADETRKVRVGHGSGDSGH